VRKLASITLVVALGFCAAGLSSRAEAGVVVGVGIGLPGVAVVAPPVIAYAPLPALYAAPYYYRYPPVTIIRLSFRTASVTATAMGFGVTPTGGTGARIG
jgi:hypothetical protein